MREMPDLFQIRRPSRSLGDAPPSLRKTMIRWMRVYLRACEREDNRLPSQRTRVNK